MPPRTSAFTLLAGRPMRRPGAWAVAGAGVAALLAGCATHRVDAQWRDAQHGAHVLSEGPVMVVCESPEVVLARLCMDRVGADLQSRGATVVAAPQEVAPPAPGQPRDDARYLAAARQAGARALWVVTVGPDPYAAEVRPGPGVSIGLGGFGGGRRGGVGVGVEIPISGGGAVTTPLYAADARVTDVAAGRLVWTARAGTPPSGDPQAQVHDLLRRLGGAAAGAGLY